MREFLLAFAVVITVGLLWVIARVLERIEKLLLEQRFDRRFPHHSE